ncbi:MAG: RNA polymerase sigma factor [Pseudomonadota bacterium]
MMVKNVLTDADAKSAREQWFRFLDVVEPCRAELHAYCLSLTRTIWDAEDLVQDTLLKGYAMAARGDLHGVDGPVRNTKAYLFRVASNHWIDQQRKSRRGQLQWQAEPEPTIETEEVRPAIEKALQLSSPQEFAALVLKEGYDFTLEEIADFVGTSVGAIKSALSRGRRKMALDAPLPPVDAESRQIAQKFADAINRQDLDGVMNLMAEKMSLLVCNVGGGRGDDGEWTKSSVRDAKAKYAELEGEALVLFYDSAGTATYVVRIAASNGEVVRLTDYCYAPETLNYVARELGLEMQTRGYHQPPQILAKMIAGTTLPWLSE